MARTTLESVGKAWFVVKKYHDEVDQTQNAWEKVGHGTRDSSYNSNPELHHEWLEEIVTTSRKGLGRRNGMGLTQREILEMADELYRKGY